MKYWFLLFLVCCIIVSTNGCRPWKGNVPKGDFDVVYQTIINNSEMLGFYSTQTKTSETLQPYSPKITPYYFRDCCTTGIARMGYPRQVFNYMGFLRTLNFTYPKNNCRNADIKTNEIHPYGSELSYRDDGVVKIIDPNTCDDIKKLFDLRDIDLYKKDTSVWSYAVNKNSPFLFVTLSNYPELDFFRINMITREVLNLNRIGVNPSFSPDGKKAEYFSENGIRVMDIDGIDETQISKDRFWLPGEEFSDNYAWPKPEWSSDGKKLIYHKCEKSMLQSCLKFTDYSIFIYDFNTGKEEKILDSALNPSWVIESQP